MLNDATLGKIAVIYYSSTGDVYKLARIITEGAEQAGAQVRLRKIEETVSRDIIDHHDEWRQHLEDTRSIPVATQDDLIWSNGVIFGTPARFGNIAAQLKQFIDTLSGIWMKDLLADKVYSGFTATASAHGGQETTLMALYNSIYHFGGMLVTPGYKGHHYDTYRNPYGASYVTGEDNTIPLDEASREEALQQGQRIARMAAAMTDGLSRIT